jgi:hypothetical protein
MRPSTDNLLKTGQYWNDKMGQLINIEIMEQAYYNRKEPYEQLGWKKLVVCRRGGNFIWQTSYEYFESWVEAGIYNPVTELPQGCNWTEYQIWFSSQFD